jgi:hypothetical protein
MKYALTISLVNPSTSGYNFLPELYRICGRFFILDKGLANTFLLVILITFCKSSFRFNILPLLVSMSGEAVLQQQKFNVRKTNLP